jgi:hypothetical protein
MMKRITLEYRHCDIVTASVDSDTKEVKFDDRVVTGKMWLVEPPDAGGVALVTNEGPVYSKLMYVEIMELGGKYYLEPAA